MQVKSAFKVLFDIDQDVIVEKLDKGNGINFIRAKENDSFVIFKDNGEIYVLLKTVAPRIDRHGRRYYHCVETDAHVYDPTTGKVVDDTLEKEFKEFLIKSEELKLQMIAEESKEEAIREQVQKLYERRIIQDIASFDDDLEFDELEENIAQKKANSEMNIQIPTIRVGKAELRRIETLTPHDTITEVISILLDGSILKALLSKLVTSKWLILGAVIVGMALLIIIEVGFAAFFPTEWKTFMGIPL